MYVYVAKGKEGRYIYIYIYKWIDKIRERGRLWVMHITYIMCKLEIDLGIRMHGTRKRS